MKPILLAAALVLTCGCESTTHYNRTKVVELAPLPPKRPYGTVPLYQSQAEVPEPYTVVALMSVQGRAGEEAQFIKAFLYRAADLGADGLILYRVSQSTGIEGGGWITGNDGKGFGMPIKSTQDAVYRGEAIRFQSNTNLAPPKPAPTKPDTTRRDRK